MNLCLLSTQMDHHFIIENLPITEISERYRPYLYHAALISSTCKFSFSFFLCIYWTNGTVEKSKVKRTGKSTSSTAEMKPPFSSPTSSVLRKARFSPYLFTLLAFIVFVAVLYGEDFSCIVELGSESDGRPIGEFSSHNALTGAFFFPHLFLCPFPAVNIWFYCREEEGKAAVRHRRDRGRAVRCVQRDVGSGRVESAALRGIRVSVHTTTVDVPRTWKTWERVSVLEMETSWLLSSQVIFSFLISHLSFLIPFFHWKIS